MPLLKSCLLLFAVCALSAGLVIVLLLLLPSSEDAAFLREHILQPERLSHSLAVCFASALCALLVGMPLGLGIAGMGRGRRRALLILALLALLPPSLSLSWDAIGLGIKGQVLAVSACIGLAYVVAAKTIPDSIYHAALLSGAPRLAILTRILLPNLLPLAVASLLGGFILLLSFEGTLFSVVVCMFERGRLLLALLAMLLLILPLLSILIYLFVYVRCLRQE